jgi:nitrous oxidase accessory protein
MGRRRRGRVSGDGPPAHRLQPILLVLALLLPGSVLWGRELRVAGPEASLSAALAAAADGDVVRVVGGVHAGPFTVTTRIRLVGEGWPVLDGGERGTVLAVRGAGATVEGFRITGSGSLLDEENSGIAVEASDVEISGNRLDDVLFGIYLRRAEGSTIRGNRISGKELALARRGDPIRVWYSNRTTVEGNVVEAGRDVVLWYSNELRVVDNRVQRGRYGLHFMYCDDADIEGNLLAGNSVGAFLMYSRRLRLVGNTVANNHGPSGYGVGLKDMDDALISGNLFAGNRVGAFLDNSPREWRSETTVDGNVFAGNDAGVVLLPNVHRASFVGNGFEENLEQVAVRGEGLAPDANHWLGNYWSDYVGYDSDADGVGEVPYRSERLFEKLADRHPALRLFLHSPAESALDFAARAFPVVRPHPKLTDAAPRMAPLVLAGMPAPQDEDPTPWGVAAAGLLASVLLLAGLPWLALALPGKGGEAVVPSGGAVIEVSGLGKRYGEFAALSDLEFTIQPGEAVALWGPNGAGKTTALRALLGVIPYEGWIRVAGIDPRRDGKGVRRVVGFVPQESGLQGDLAAEEALEFFARLRRVPAERVEALVRQLGLEPHLGKRIRELSGGLRQRLALAVALLDDPPILMLDEPAANLDPVARSSFYQLLLELKAAGKTLIFTSHRMEEVSLLADRVLGLDGGRLRRDGPPHELPLTGSVEVTISFEAQTVERADAALRAAGYASRRVGRGLALTVPERSKIAPLVLLISEGHVPVDVAFAQLAEGVGDRGAA